VQLEEEAVQLQSSHDAAIEAMRQENAQELIAWELHCHNLEENHARAVADTASQTREEAQTEIKALLERLQQSEAARQAAERDNHALSSRLEELTSLLSENIRVEEAMKAVEEREQQVAARERDIKAAAQHNAAQHDELYTARREWEAAHQIQVNSPLTPPHSILTN
jgi:hypothetical protein